MPYSENKAKKVKAKTAHTFGIITGSFTFINALIDDRENLNIGNRINDVYTLGTPRMIILGNKYDKENFEIENTKDSTKQTVNKKDIIKYLKEEK